MDWVQIIKIPPYVTVGVAHRYIYFALSGLTADSQFSIFNFQFSTQQSPERTTVPRQAVECEARNPCIHDQNDIKSAEGTTETEFLSCLQHFDLF